MNVFFINRDDGSISSRIQIKPSESETYAGNPDYVFESPPPCGPGFAPRWTGEEWECAVDHRGSIWHQPGRADSFVIARLGEAPQDGWLSGPAPAPPAPPSYLAARQAAYPAIGDQLDMLWHAMDQDPSKRLEPFYTAIKAVKTAYPSDSSVPPGSAVVYQAG